MMSYFSRSKDVLIRFKYLVLAVLLIGGFIVFGGGGEELGATLRVERGDFVQQVSVSGSVVAAKDAELGFAASGRISGVYAHVGQRVGAGTILAETENEDLAAALSQKRFALKEAEAKLASLRSGTRKEEIVVAEATVANAEAALVDAIRSAYTTADDAVHNKADTLFTNPRTNPLLSFSVSNANLKIAVEIARKDIEATLATWALLNSGLSPSSVLAASGEAQGHLTKISSFLADVNAAVNQGVPDQSTTSTTFATYSTTLATARSNIETVSGQVTSDRADLVAARANLSLKQAGSTTETIAAQEAAVAGAEAEVRSASSALAKTRVVAPFAGVVTRMDAKVGEIVSPTTSLIGIQSDGVFQIETFIPEVAISRVAVGNTATTTLDAYGTTAEFTSTVIAVDPAETLKDGVPAYKTTLAFTVADPRIRSGMTASVKIETGVISDAVVIPAGAVGSASGVSYVSVLEGETVRNVRVTTGVAPSLGQAHILSGLVGGEVIVLAPRSTSEAGVP